MADKLTLWDSERNAKCDVRIYKTWKLARPDNLEDVIPWKSDEAALAKFVRDVYDCHRYEILGAVRLRLETDEFIIRGHLSSMLDTWYEPDFSFYSFRNPFRIEVKDANPTTKIGS